VASVTIALDGAHLPHRAGTLELRGNGTFALLVTEADGRPAMVAGKWPFEETLSAGAKFDNLETISESGQRRAVRVTIHSVENEAGGTPPRHLRDTTRDPPETLPAHFRDRHEPLTARRPHSPHYPMVVDEVGGGLRDASEAHLRDTPRRHLPHTSETLPTHVRDAPRHSRDAAETDPRRVLHNAQEEAF